MFALKQICYDSGERKFKVGYHTIQKIIEDIKNPEIELTMEYIHHAMLLLQMFATTNTNCSQLMKYNAVEVLGELKKNPLVAKQVALWEKVHLLQQTIARRALDS